tara:strand:+ start:487 stop:1536 length:1050 start_codon:yes stop_codon:yes gene_type:complete
MEFSAGQIAELIQGELQGSESITVNNLSKIDQGVPNTLSFLYNAEFANHLYTTDASVIITSKGINLTQELAADKAVIWVDDARMAFAQILSVYKQQRQQSRKGIHPTAHIDESAKIGENVYIGPYVIVESNSTIGDNTFVYANTTIGENVQIGSDCLIYTNVSVYDDSVIGNDCILQSGAVIGGDGFGFQPNQENNYTKIVHIGNVILEDHVEIGANTTIDKATLGSTIIRKGAKLDNLIQVGHNVEIGENTVIAAQTGVAGSTIIGKNCMIGGQVGFAGHQKIADGVKIAAKTGVPKDLESEGIFQGIPAMPIGDFRRSHVMYKNLPKLGSDIKELKKELEELKSKNK